MDQYEQLSFADAEYANKGKVTRREKFMNQLEALLPWSVMRAVIEPHYASGKGCGRKQFALNAMLHVHVAQIVYNYSDPGKPKGTTRRRAVRDRVPAAFLRDSPGDGAR